MNYNKKINPSKYFKNKKFVPKGNFEKQDNFYFSMENLNIKKVEKNFDFYLYYAKTQKLVKVCKKTFNQAKGIYRCVHNHRIKFVGTTKEKVDVAKFKSLFKAEGNKSMYSYMKIIYTYITNLVDNIESLKCVNFKELILDVISFFLSIYGQYTEGSIFNLAAILFDFYRLVSRKYVMKAEGLESFVFSAASMFMPKSLFEVFKRMQTFSNVKILDDFKIFQDVLLCVFEFLRGCINLLPVSDKVKNKIFEVVDKFLNFNDYFIMKEMRDLILLFKNDIRITSDICFQNRVNVVKEKLKDNIFISEWSKKSNSAKILFEDFNYIIRVVDSYLASSRVEPCCFIFEGPAGCGKSLMLNTIASLLGKSKYVHSTKSFMDGKNFYDMYNNEYLYIEDDIGQQGVSQWRTIINFVSSVKCPLDCAEIKNKGIKFFSSPVLLLSTNHFINLPPLLRSDCISEVQALHRRGYVFDFNNVKINGEGWYVGEMVFRTFDVFTNKWVGFSQDMSAFLVKHKCNLKNTLKIDIGSFDSNLKLFAWVKDIINMCSKLKLEYASQSDISRWKDEVNKYSIFNAETKAYKFEYKGVNIGHFVPSFLNFDESFFESQEIWINGCQVIITGLEQYFHSPTLDFFLWLMWRINDGLIFTIHDPNACPDLFIASLMCSLLNFLVIYIVFKLTRNCVTGIINKLVNKKEEENVQNDFKAESTDLHPTIYAIQKQLFEIDLISQAGLLQAHGLCSGHCIVTASHLVKGNEGFITLYKNRLVNHRLLDNKKFKVVYRDDKTDIVVIMIDEFFPTPFKNLSKHFKEFGEKSTPKLWYINALGATELQSKIVNKNVYDKYYLTYDDGSCFEGKIDEKNLLYTIRGDGQCGSLIVSPFKGIIGMHVAGSSVNGMGVASFFPKEVIAKINSILALDDKCFLDTEISSKEQHDFSGIKIDLPIAASTPKTTNFEKSPLYGLFEVEREPVNLSVFGPHTVKDIAKKSFKPVSMVTLDEAKFVENTFSNFIECFDDISEREVVLGGDLLARMNKDSCNGFKKLKDKSDYIDYAQGCYTPLLVEERKQFITNCVEGKINYEDIVWVETLKDELRSVEKNKVPRSFRYCNVVIQCLSKEIFGNLVRSILQTKWFNGIMIGINPYKDWDKLYDVINNETKEGGFFDGDFKNWDGSMLPQIQEIIISVLCSKYCGKLPMCVVKIILQSLVGCLVVVNDDTYITNHSMPSGFFLTTLVNCFVNICYAILYYHRVRSKAKLLCTVKGFFDTLKPLTYGDDLIMLVKRDPDLFNAVTYAEFCDNLGLGFTDANKNQIKNKFTDFNSLTFLKRRFKFDNRIQRIMCPLDVRTIRSSIMFYDSTKDMNTVLGDKIHAFQREIYLHEELYEQYVDKLCKFCETKGILFNRLPQNYLEYLYKNEPDALFDTTYR